MKSVELLRTNFCSQKATDLLYPDEEDQEPVLPLLYFTLDQDEQAAQQWTQNPMPSRPMQVSGQPLWATQDALSEQLNLQHFTLDQGVKALWLTCVLLRGRVSECFHPDIIDQLSTASAYISCRSIEHHLS